MQNGFWLHNVFLTDVAIFTIGESMKNNYKNDIEELIAKQNPPQTELEKEVMNKLSEDTKNDYTLSTAKEFKDGSVLMRLDRKAKK